MCLKLQYFFICQKKYYITLLFFSLIFQMKKIRIIIFLCITNHSIAHSFSEKTSNGFIFAGEENSAAAFVDIDNDGDEDLLYSKYIL